MHTCKNRLNPNLRVSKTGQKPDIFGPQNRSKMTVFGHFLTLFDHFWTPFLSRNPHFRPYVLSQRGSGKNTLKTCLDGNHWWFGPKKVILSGPDQLWSKPLGTDQDRSTHDRHKNDRFLVALLRIEVQNRTPKWPFLDPFLDPFLTPFDGPSTYRIS